MSSSAALSAGDLTNLRAGSDTVKRYLAVVPQTQVATARINQATILSPNAGFIVDATSAGWLNGKKGMTAWVGTSAGAKDIGVYRLRADNDTNVIFLGQMSLGDPGLLSLSILDELEDDAYVTIYQNRSIWSVFPTITYSGGVDARSGTFYKDNDDAYTTQNETAPDFVLNIGGHNADEIDPSTSVITESRTATVSAWLAGTTVSSYLWDVGDGTITVGSTSTASITVTYPAGYREISCTVTLSTGAVRTVYRHVWARDPASVTNHLDIDILSDRRDVLGRSMRFRAIDALGALEDGAMALYWEEASWNGNSIASATTTFAGWVRSIAGTRDPDTASQEFELVSAMHILSELKAFGQQLVVVADPGNWQEVISGLSHIDYWIFYLLNFHTTVLDLFDYELSALTTLLAKAWQVGSGSWAAVLNQAGARVNASVGQRSDGTIFVRRNPQLMDQTDRDAVIERMTLTEADVGLIPITRTLRPRVGKVKASAFAWDGTDTIPYLAVAPGNVGGQGADEASLDDQLITSAGGQAELNERAANEWARLNNPYAPLSLPLPRNFDVFEPAERYWVRLTIAAAYMPDGVAFNKRCLVNAVTVNHEPDTKNLVIELEPETSGIGALASTVAVILPNLADNAGFVSGNSYFPDFSFDTTTGLPIVNYNPLAVPDFAAPPDPLPESTLVPYMFVSGGDISQSNDVAESSPAWTTQLDPGAGWTVEDLVHRQSYDLAAKKLAMWAVASESATQDTRLYYNSAVINSGTWTIQQALTDVQIFVLRYVPSVADGKGISARARDMTTDDHYIYFSDDNFATYSSISIGNGAFGGGRYDVDDFGLGVFIVGLFDDVYYTTSYTDSAATLLAGLTASTGVGTISSIRIPYRRTVDDALNNDKTALEFLVAVSDAIAGACIWRVTFNANTGAVASQVDITPVVGGTTYTARNSNGLTVTGGDGQIIILIGVATATTDPRDLLLSQDGGGTWSKTQTGVSYQTVFVVDGSDSEILLMGGSVVGYSADKGTTITDQSGDLADSPLVAGSLFPL